MRREQSRERDEGGFSLVEVLVAAVLMTVAALAVAGGIVSAVSTGTHAGEQGRAVALAVQKMESLKARPASEVKTEAPVSVDADGVEGSGPYTRKVDVTEDPEGPNTLGVTVTVEYSTGYFGERAVELYTVFFRSES